MFTVRWRDWALDQLADAMVASDLATQDAIERSVLGVNARLAVDPMSVGESRRHDRERIVFHQRAAVVYLVDVTFRVVHVVRFVAV